MSEDTTLEHLRNTVDGYTRAKSESERMFFLRAALRGLATLASGAHGVLVALIAAVSKEIPQ